MIYFSQLADLTSGNIISLHRDAIITQLLLDSRKATEPEGTLFFAIRGDRHDGHHYLKNLYDSGYRQFVVEKSLDLNAFPDCNIIQVPSAIAALQALAKHHRMQFNYPVIAITGSNGKTIIKEWLFQILSKHEIPVKNPGSYNSQIGVPLSVWQMQKNHTVGVFEAGISTVNEMENLAQIIQPTLGVFTNIGPAHAEGFTSIEHKVQEKIKLFNTAETVVYCKDHVFVDSVLKDVNTNLVSWGTSSEADVIIEKQNDSYHVKWKNQTLTFFIPFQDKASIENCIHVIIVLLCMGYRADHIQDGITSLKAVPMRLELKEGINQCQVIDDTYNNDLGGIEMGLQFLLQQNQRKKKTVILSDVLQSGLTEDVLVLEISKLIKQSGIDRLIGIGPVLKKHYNKFKVSREFYSTTKEFLAQYSATDWQNEIILVKGARSFEFEKIVSKLQRKVHGTVMEIDLNALVHNLNYFKSCIHSSTKIMVMVKAFAYGSGSNEIASLLQYHRVDYLGVAYADEGVELRKNNITIPILVMNPTEESFDQILIHQLEPEIYNLNILHSLLKFLNGNNCKIHIKLDTGMHRLGFESNTLDQLIDVLKTNKNLQVASIFTHLAGADDAIHDDFSNVQATVFQRGADQISNAIGYKPLYHVLNTPGILRLPQFQFDMVRLGIGLYGINPTEEENKNILPVATLKSIISQIKKVSSGDTVGYGRHGVVTREMKIGTIAIGYADGFSRSFSKGVGRVIVNGKQAPVIGNVCMDMTMIDLTDIHASEGDEVIVFGKELPIQEVASSVNTIPYEILTNTSERVKRIFIAGSV